MCCFSRPVKNVTATKIFAREGAGAGQFVAYEMSLDAPTDVAMVLPTPIEPHKGEKALTFISLESNAEVFSQLSALFPTALPGLASARSKGPVMAAATIEVQRVGAYDASFVPTPQDFSRLDERFRMPADFWNKLPQYKGWGFAVFKLRAGQGRYHPMAFSFERADTRRLFFPTVHVHDGKVRPRAQFDHELYCQPGREKWNLDSWQESTGPAKRIQTPQNLVDPEDHVYRMQISGLQPNQDTFVVKL